MSGWSPVKLRDHEMAGGRAAIDERFGRAAWSAAGKRRAHHRAVGEGRLSGRAGRSSGNAAMRPSPSCDS